MYRSAHSQVLLAGGHGERFSISRSVRQGCPLAPTLFLFFAEAMSSFLTAQNIGLQGLCMPVREEALLDSEFADDIAVYLHGHEANLTQFQVALEQFCNAYGAKINWHKSCGFWVSEGAAPSFTRFCFGIWQHGDICEESKKQKIKKENKSKCENGDMVDCGSRMASNFLTFYINPAKVQCNTFPSLARACKSSILYVNSFSNSEGSHIS